MPDRPLTPSSKVPIDYMDGDLRFHEYGCPCEWGESYRPGGFHPVQIGDILSDRYEILRKLGHGSSSTVWLAADRWSRLFVAVKILKARFSHAEHSELSLYALLDSAEDETCDAYYLNDLLNSFELFGPNGRHTCLVFEAMGPTRSDMLRPPDFKVCQPFDGDFCYRFPRDLAKRVLGGVLRGLEYLHSNQVVHGDVHKGNILMNVLLPQYTVSSIESLRQPLDEARPLERLDGKKDLWAPPYLLPSANLRSCVSTQLEPLAMLTDLGGAFRPGMVPENITTPEYLRAPETILGLTNTIGPGIDIWSFGCLVFELLTGSSLFMVSKMSAGGQTLDDVHLIQLTEVIGPLPEQVFHAWRRGPCYFGASSTRRIYNADGHESLESYASPDTEANKDEDGLRDSDGGKTAFSTDDMVTSELEDGLARVRLSESLEATFSRNTPEDMGATEEKQILHLLRWILQHDPAKRPSAGEILGHEWFQM